MLFRRSGQVAMQAALLLALEREAGPRTVREMVIRLGVPAAYLAKMLQALARTGLLRSVRGPRGGFQLARPAAEVHLWEVLEAVDHVSHLSTCLLGLGECESSRACPLHKDWAPIRNQIIALLQTRSLEDIVSAGGQNLGCRFGVAQRVGRPARAEEKAVRLEQIRGAGGTAPPPEVSERKKTRRNQGVRDPEGSGREES